MVQNNKVLTVSYGTFSCTLEGFDDSFETMKAIAEYFRDLAAEDRYFGSEPPQPDAEMLTRIAQRDAARKIEASQNESGLLLRATEEPPTVAPAPVAPPQPPQAHLPPETPDIPASVEPAMAEPVAPPPAAADSPPEDSIAAKLQRIRAVVSHNDASPAQLSDDEENDSDFMAAPKPKVDAVAAAFAAGALTPADLEEINPEDTPEAPTPEPFVSPETEALTEVESAPTPTEQSEATFAPAPPLTHNDDEDGFGPQISATTEMAVAPEPTEVAVAEDEQEDVTTDDVHFAESAPEVEDEVQTLLDEDDSTHQPEPEADQQDFALNILSVEDEARLLDEIALVESELAAHTVEDTPQAASDEEEDVSRLMASVDARLDDPSTGDQRQTYSHLRAAVAATEADRKTADADKAPSPDQDYRGDLASVVSPRRPEVQVTSSRPETAGAAPLKLVAEQRIDAESAEVGTVTPRRISQSEEDQADDEGGFASFAQEQGAQSLPDLLEAAAAYLSFIEGQEQFSRPQLMNKVRALKQEDFNREESLRSFGQLLRDGKIEKTGGGRFAASDEIGFRPDDKRAAG